MDLRNPVTHNVTRYAPDDPAGPTAGNSKLTGTSSLISAHLASSRPSKPPPRAPQFPLSDSRLRPARPGIPGHKIDGNVAPVQGLCSATIPSSAPVVSIIKAYDILWVVRRPVASLSRASGRSPIFLDSILCCCIEAHQVLSRKRRPSSQPVASGRAGTLASFI